MLHPQFIARRGDNGRVFGAYLYNGAPRDARYYQNGEMKNFMFRVTSSTDNVDFAQNIGQHGRHGYVVLYR